MALSAVCLTASVLTTVETQTEPEDLLPLATAEDLRLNEERSYMENYFQLREKARRQDMSPPHTYMLAVVMFQHLEQHVQLATELYETDRRYIKIIALLAHLAFLCQQASEKFITRRAAAAHDPK
jgi:hypothetical protein